MEKHGGSNINVLIPQGFGKRITSVRVFTLKILFFTKHYSLSTWIRASRVAIIYNKRCQSVVVIPGFFDTGDAQTLTHTHSRGETSWVRYFYSPCLFWRCFNAGESGMLVVPVWKTTAIKRAFFPPRWWKCSAVFCRQQQHLSSAGN